MSKSINSVINRLDALSNKINIIKLPKPKYYVSEAILELSTISGFKLTLSDFTDLVEETKQHLYLNLKSINDESNDYKLEKPKYASIDSNSQEVKTNILLQSKLDMLKFDTGYVNCLKFSNFLHVKYIGSDKSIKLNNAILEYIYIKRDGLMRLLNFIL
jgi:DNA-directed RNA polymerase alpha subunit